MRPLVADKIPESVIKRVEQRISQVETKVLRAIEVEKELIEFEILASMLIKPQKKINSIIRNERKKAWKTALKKAKGNREKAIKIFDRIYP